MMYAAVVVKRSEGRVPNFEDKSIEAQHVCLQRFILAAPGGRVYRATL